MGQEPTFDPSHNVLTLGGRRLVFHCHHYNLFLQRSIGDMFGDGAMEMQVAAAAEVARRLFEELPQAERFEERLRAAAFVFSDNGFGSADLGELSESGGVVTLRTSHYAVGWRAKWKQAPRPVCHFATGFWAGALVVAAGLAPERVWAREEQCAAVEAGSCRIRLEVR